MFGKPIKGQKYSCNGEVLTCSQVGLKYAILVDERGAKLTAKFASIENVTPELLCINPSEPGEMEQFYAAQRVTQAALDSFRKKAVFK